MNQGTRAREPQASRRQDWYSIRNEGDGDSATTEILIYDRIGASWWGGVSAKDFAKDLSAIDSDEIVVRVNSPGGNVYEGIAILNALRSHKARIVVYVDGLAASAASFIAMAGDEIIMRRNSELMIHDAWGFCEGNAEEMRRAAADLDRVSNNIASVYHDRAGGTVDDWRNVMRNEVWYSGSEAVDAGLADRVEASASEDDSDAEDAKAAFDLSVFNYAGRKAAPPPDVLAMKASTPVVEPSAADTSNNEGGSDVSFTDEQTGELREALSLPEDATDQEIFDAVLEKLTAPPAPPTDNSIAGLVSALSTHGLVAIENSRLQSFETEAAQFRKFREEREEEIRTNQVSAAIRLGQIPTASKEHWLKTLAVDPGAAEVLASLPKGLIPVAELGHSVDPGNASDDLSWFDTVTTKEA